MDKRKKRWGRIWLFIFMGCCIQWVIYFLTAKVLGKEGMEYRSWIQIMETAVFVFVLPISGIMALFFTIREREKTEAEYGRSASGFRLFGFIALFLICAAVAAVELLFFGVFGSSIFEKEEIISPDVMLGRKDILFDSSVEGTYYRPYGILLKKEYKYYEEPVVLAILGQRYGKRIGTVGLDIKEKENGISYYVYELEMEGEKGIRFHAVPVPGIMPGYKDDYKEIRAIERGKEYALKKGIERFIEAEDAEYSALKSPGFVCSGREDMEDCAGQASAVIAYILEEPFIQDKGIRIPVICSNGRKEKKTVMLEIGNVFGQRNKKEYYTEKENIYKALQEAYDGWDREITEKRKEKVQAEKEYEEAQEQTPLADRDGLLTPEGAYEKLYQAVFEPEGDKYECFYNAKGNFYAVLGEEEEIKEGETLRTRRTVVYDRISKNNKCQLFVYYKEYYDEDGLDRGTLILNFYAVDRSTGKVTAGEKTAWAETASKEYQEASGEK